MDIRESTELMAKYGDCPECGNIYVGNGQGTLNIEDDIFTRSCKCGWKVTVDRRIKHRATMTKKKGSKLIGGVYEVAIHDHGRKLLPLLELKEKSGFKRINQHDFIESWLNGPEGRKWTLEVKEGTVL